MWSYPVVRERCSCGASTETVLIDHKDAAAYFEKWRDGHACPRRANQ